MVYKFVENLELLDVNEVYVGLIDSDCAFYLGADGYSFPGGYYDKLKPVPRKKAEANLKPIVIGMFEFAEEHYCERTSLEFRMLRDYYGIGTKKLGIRQMAKKYGMKDWALRQKMRDRFSFIMKSPVLDSWRWLFVVALFLPEEEYKLFLDAMRDNRGIIRKELRNVVPILKCIGAE